MANKGQDNLIPFSERSEEEARELGRKGGIASGEARREKATMLQTLEQCLNATNKNGQTYKELATLGLIKGAVNGSSKNYEIIQQLMERKERKDEETNIYVVLPAKDIASSFSDINRDIDDRGHREYYLEGGRGSTKSSYISEKIIELL